MNLLLPTGSALGRRACGLAGSVALHVLIAALIALLPVGVRVAAEPSSSGNASVSTFAVAPDDLAAKPADRVLDDTTDAGESIPRSDDAEFRVAALAVDLDRIQARVNWLFPFLTTDLLFLERARDKVGIPDGTIASPLAFLRRPAGRPWLALSNADLQRVVDRAWSRRERWTRFTDIVRFVETYDPNGGRVPDLLRTYLDQNLLQPYYDAKTRDPRFWAMLECVADHVEFIDWVRSFTRQHPSSRATTELLLLLDEFAQGSRDTLLMLLATNPEHDLEYTRSVSKRAYDLAVVVRRQYADWLRDHQLASPEPIRRRYDDLRLRLLTTIIETTPDGYRVADARFLAGEILFNQNNSSDALRMWGAIRPDRRDSYVEAYSEILAEMHSPNGATASEINRILGAEHRRWLDFSAERLRQFGYAFDTF